MNYNINNAHFACSIFETLNIHYVFEYMFNACLNVKLILYIALFVCFLVFEMLHIGYIF